MSIIEYAKNELARIDHDDYGLQDLMDDNIIELLKVFSDQGHTGFSANCCLTMFNRLANFKPLTPLTGDDDEWKEVGNGAYQNKRYPAVFKESKNGHAYNIEAKIFSDDGGDTWFTNHNSWAYIDFPYDVPDKPEKVYMVKNGENTITAEEESND